MIVNNAAEQNLASTTPHNQTLDKFKLRCRIPNSNF